MVLRREQDRPSLDRTANDTRFVHGRKETTVIKYNGLILQIEVFVPRANAGETKTALLMQIADPCSLPRSLGNLARRTL